MKLSVLILAVATSASLSGLTACKTLGSKSSVKEDVPGGGLVAEKLAGLTPVVIVTREGQDLVPANFHNKLTDAFRVAFLKAAANAGTGAAIEKDSSNATSDTSFDLFRVLADFDSQFSIQVKSGSMADDLRNIPEKQSGRYLIEAFLVPSNSPHLANLRNMNEPNLLPEDVKIQLFKRLQWAAAAADTTGEISEIVNSAGQAIDDTLMFSGGSPAAGAAYHIGADAYMKVAIARKDAASKSLAMPGPPVAFVAMELSFNNKAVTFTTRLRAWPSDLYQSIPVQPGPVAISMMSYHPYKNFEEGMPAVIGLTFLRTFGLKAEDSVPAVAAIDFGRMGPMQDKNHPEVKHQDIREMQVCLAFCANEIELVPTMIGKITLGEKFLAKFQGNPYTQFAYATASSIAGSINDAVHARINVLSAWDNFQPLEVDNDIYILLTHLQIDLAASNGVKINPTYSQAHLIIGGQNGRLEIHPNQSKVFSYNLYNLPIPGSPGVAVMNGLNEKITPAFSDARNKINDSMRGMFAKIFDLFKSTQTP